MRIFWFALGCVSLLAGLIGIVLPLLPTVPFLLLAAFGFARSSERVHDWLIEHPRLGPPIQDWRESGAIARRTKWIASASVLAAFLLAVAFSVPVHILAIQAGTLCLVALFIWTRPEG